MCGAGAHLHCVSNTPANKFRNAFIYSYAKAKSTCYTIHCMYHCGCCREKRLHQQFADVAAKERDLEQRQGNFQRWMTGQEAVIQQR